jgi:hypothetical protein
MKALKALLAISCTALGGCAVTPEWNSEAAEAVRPMRDMHRACMIANAAGIDDRSQDPRSIVANIEGLCAPLLEPMRTYIAQQGYGEDVADSYVEQVMADSRQEAEDTLMRVRRQARRTP